MNTRIFSVKGMQFRIFICKNTNHLNARISKRKEESVEWTLIESQVISQCFIDYREQILVDFAFEDMKIITHHGIKNPSQAERYTKLYDHD